MPFLTLGEAAMCGFFGDYPDETGLGKRHHGFIPPPPSPEQLSQAHAKVDRAYQAIQSLADKASDAIGSVDPGDSDKAGALLDKANAALANLQDVVGAAQEASDAVTSVDNLQQIAQAEQKVKQQVPVAQRHAATVLGYVQKAKAQVKKEAAAQAAADAKAARDQAAQDAKALADQQKADAQAAREQAKADADAARQDQLAQAKIDAELRRQNAQLAAQAAADAAAAGAYSSGGGGVTSTGVPSNTVASQDPQLHAAMDPELQAALQAPIDQSAFYQQVPVVGGPTQEIVADMNPNLPGTPAADISAAVAPESMFGLGAVSTASLPPSVRSQVEARLAQLQKQRADGEAQKAPKKPSKLAGYVKTGAIGFGLLLAARFAWRHFGGRRPSALTLSNPRRPRRQRSRARGRRV